MIQAGVRSDRVAQGFPPIMLEPTNITGILHKDGVVSMARSTTDSAKSNWFICINDQPTLDFGGSRHPEGQGFSAFGRVISGMDVVRTVRGAPPSADASTDREAQHLTPPIKILKMLRIAG